MKQAISTAGAPAAIGPYSQAMVVGNLVMTSGQIPLTPAGELVGEGIEAQTRQCLENVQAILQEAGLTMNHVVKTTVFLQDMNDFAAMNGVYGQFFQEPFPVRSCVQVARLPRDVRVEIEAMALRP
ncbi:RidA family protein [Heliophilum fasciatum]|uniref:Endoribonuclease L-PSP n=1 Tax=Heliophilum fasciatum TaxID=35700 RepID=A0A4R2RYU9_9FIRM|nr:RidA family protein [Heliophilum fasciatum]MCW2277518.1 2-iminobutanoate/2-iminopropanoate deaminase [Heliophilum fasciatum]TCP65191.1 endoribonuclease L-PSP [Heliophilum fasciatum]